VVQWLLLLAANDKAVGEVFNLGNPEEVTIAELARQVIAVTGANVAIDYVPYEQAYEKGFEDMQRRVPDISKVKALTGFAPRVSLEQALRRTVEWFKSDRVLERSAAFEHAAPAPAAEVAR
jgi:UDP-glucose 4-epimerase